ncbi:MAG: histidine--tRNA ligase [Deltaproteobacteria bacterium]|nr:histidine--tRNA ligase [Deltaproteobacteria bacterium]
MIHLIKGFRDVLPPDSSLWRRVEATAQEVFGSFGFSEIRLPIMERTELFARSIGADTDIVEKEMYTFEDRGGDLLTLRPEATAGVVRALIQHGLTSADPARKLYTTGPMFRRERPQKGRFRQFYQLNAEFFGAAGYEADVLVILALVTLLEKLDTPDVSVHINSLGCPDCRPGFKQVLKDFVAQKKADLCENCLRRHEANPLRVLDCKVPGCRDAVEGAPSIREHLCQSCRDHFAAVTGSLSELGIKYVENPRLVRGLDYYTRTTFEVQTTSLGAQNAVAGGGRYDGLVEALGGPATPAVGFAVGMDRLVELLSEKTVLPKDRLLFIACLGDEAKKLGFSWQCALNRRGIAAEIDYAGKGLKSQMKRADRLNADFVLMLGEDELKNQSALLRDMETKEQVPVPFDGIVERLAQILSNT